MTSRCSSGSRPPWATPHDGWFRFERGHGAEQAVDDGDTTLGNVSDETPQRGQYRQWKALMTAEG